MVKAVLFDVDNTLLDFNASAKEAIKAAFNELGLDFSDRVMDVFLRLNEVLWQRIEKKEMTREDLHNVRWKTIFNELHIDADGLNMERLFLKHLKDYAIPIDGAQDIIKYLSAKYDIYTASNAPYLQQVNRLTISGIMPYIKRIISFESQGIYKPQKRYFEQCLKEMSPAKSDEIVLIGDSLSADMRGGKDVGFTTVWFNPSGKVAPEGLCDFTVKSLSEIKNIL